MAIGRRMRNAKQLRKAMQSKKPGLIQFIGKEGSRTVRFLEEPEGNWVEYDEHYDPQARTSFPCVGDEDGCPGCEAGLNTSTRFIANALDVDQDRAIVMQMPKTLANQVYKFYDKYDTLLDRDYELTREGEGRDTEYAAFAEDKMKRSLKKYELKDLEAVLEEVAEAYLKGVGDDEDEDEDDRPRRRSSATKKRQRSKAAPRSRTRRQRDEDEDDYDDEDEDDYEDDEDEDEDEAPRRKSKKPPTRSSTRKPTRRRRPVDEDDEDEDDEEEDDEPEDDEEEDDEEEDDEEEDDEEEDEDDESEYYTEDELNDMTVAQLRIVAKEYGVKVTGMKKPDLVAAILGD